MTAPTCDDTETRPAAARGREAVFVLVGGVPGAGKSTLLARAADHPRVRAFDTDQHRRALGSVLPPWVPYRAYRAVVHGLHWAALLAALWRGPDGGHDGDVLLVHEPATRPARREWLARLAVRRRWRPVLLLVDVDRVEALAGQRRRGRVVRGASFDRHWERWSAQRPGLLEAAASGRGVGAWQEVHVVGRRQAPAVLADLVG